MNREQQKYEVVIGLEVHAQLLTESKLFSGDATTFGAAPNTHVSPITLGHPGTLPMMNEKAISHAIKMGIACNSEIERTNYFARKNYFYPDLPKGYQISQHTTPICKGGYVPVIVKGERKNIQLTRIHLEEDAGKSIHDIDPSFTCIDYNRAGVALVEIVSEPDIRSGEEAFAFLTELRKLVRWIGVCDGNMEEGSMRCDANISLRPWGEKTLGTKVEVKNLNSIRNVKKAIEIETERLTSLLDSGQEVLQETRSFNADDDTTFSIRTKEDADDYRYFPDPDLAPFIISEADLEKYRKEIPRLPEEWVQVLISDFQLPEYDARILVEEPEMLKYFLSVTETCRNYKAVSNFFIGPIKSYCNDNGLDIDSIQITPAQWKNMIDMIDDGRLNFSMAATKLLPHLVKDNTKDPSLLAEELNIIQVSDSGDLEAWAEEVLNKMPDKVSEFRKGKKGLIGLFVGEVKKISAGKADPRLTTEILFKKLNQT
jgi:aspartyl-tRNA(Asn)/glutamyl-tRNA(Gln) amidotransferase subunit B